jgi:hypothetical protein
MSNVLDNAPRVSYGALDFHKATPEQICAEWHRLDAAFSTDKHSPLHHDNRCAIHGDAFHRRKA